MPPTDNKDPMHEVSTHCVAETSALAKESWSAETQWLLQALENQRKAFSPESQRLTDRLIAALGVGATMRMLLEDRYSQSGGAVERCVYAMHDLFSAVKFDEEGDDLTAFEPFLPWLEVVAANPDSKWRAAWQQWLEVMTERLTMHRYTDARHRRQQVQKLITAPLRIALLEADPNLQATHPDPELSKTLTTIGIDWLRFIDLMNAEQHRELGWNRIDVQDVGDRMGGFYGMADEARIPEPETIRQTAASLLAELKSERASLSAAIQSRCPQLLEIYNTTQNIMIEAFEHYLKHAGWPQTKTKKRGGIIGFLKKMEAIGKQARENK